MGEIFSGLPVVLSLVLVEGLLSIDNALVLAAMVQHLPDAQRQKALTYGLIGAYVFRGLALLFVAFLENNPSIKVLGAAYLIYLCFDELGSDSSPEEEKAHHHARKLGLWGTVIQVEMMDLVFGVDNVIAAVALSNKLWAVYLGVFIGILVMRFVAAKISRVMERYPILQPTGFVLVGLIGVMFIAEVGLHLHFGHWGKFAAIIGTVAAMFYVDGSPRMKQAIDPAVGSFRRLMSRVVDLVDALLMVVTVPARLIMNAVVKGAKRGDAKSF